MATWFTADLHLGHKRIIELCDRPFSDVDEMNAEIIKRWNMVVERGDTVYVLGDVAMGTIAESLPLVSQLEGDKILVPGNHDRCWTGNERVRVIDIDRYLEVGFTIIEGPLRLEPENWLMSHFPYAGDSQEEDRYVDHRPEDRGDWLIHGHVHNEWLVNGRQINVGVDVWDYYPVSRAQIRATIASQEATRAGSPWPERQT